ncbi:protein kinase domain-containing protein [Actinoplanes friuliensis]|uniref:protein kinase domain-containing protein n=1 Tax=Actinoplanes friuliensis TaxID=196914 RepID=UPI0009FCC8F0|nr:protein kinase [Actinoplanes friuliensis]
MYLGLQFGHYLVKDFINNGGFGMVFEAEDTRNARVVAIKILKLNPDRGTLAEFDNEDELLFKLRGSSNVIARIDAGTGKIPLTQTPSFMPIELDVHYIVMELAQACLEDLLAYRDILGWQERIRLFRGLVKGMHQMHLKEVVHRDLKAGNCLVVWQGRGHTETKVSDLGRSRDLKNPPKHHALEYLAGRGDLRFAPPELLWMQGFDNPRVWMQADLYGLGSVLFELATGQGITGVALGSGPDHCHRISKMPPNLRRAHFESQIGDMRGRYELAFDMFKAELPKSIANQMTELVRQLCDPDPSKRVPRVIAKSQTERPGLQWLLRRVDILARMLRNAEAQEEKNRRRKESKP